MNAKHSHAILIVKMNWYPQLCKFHSNMSQLNNNEHVSEGVLDGSFWYLRRNDTVRVTNIYIYEKNRGDV